VLIISDVDEYPGLWIESLAIIELRGVKQRLVLFQSFSLLS
jgi:hypothetical protein